MFIQFYVRKNEKEQYERQAYDFPIFEHEVKGEYFKGFWHKYHIDKKCTKNGRLVVYATQIPNKFLLYQ